VATVAAGALHLGGCYEGLPSDAGLATGTTTSDGDPSMTDGSDSVDEGPQGGEECEQRTADPLRRLTHTQYLRSVERLTAVPIPERMRNLLAPVPASEGAFDNAAEDLVLRQSDADAYQRIAEYVARFVFEAEEAPALVTCDETTDACLEEFIASFGALAYRRPLEVAERDRIAAVARGTENATALGVWAPFATAVELMLQSPNFLFVPEIGVATDVEAVVQLQPRELATRLALVLWDGVPDRALLDRAEAGELDDEEGRRRVVQEMLADPRAREGSMRFAGAWFELDALAHASFGTAPSDAAAAVLRSDARAELAAMLEHHVVDGDLRDLYLSSETWVTPALASLYGIDVPAEANAPGSAGLLHVELDPDARRGGLLGTAAFLATYASGEHPSLVRRGAYVRRVTLCTEPPPPPPDVEMGEMQEDDHASQPECWACHQLLDPIGWGLDRYAADGSLREALPSGEPVREEGYLVDYEGSEFSDAPSLGAVLVGTDAFTHCSAEKTAQWVLAKPFAEVEGCFVDDLVAQLDRDGFHVPALVARVVASETFTLRVIPEEGDE
jgi:hypothetical protein